VDEREHQHRPLTWQPNRARPGLILGATNSHPATISIRDGLAAYERETTYLLGWNPAKPPEGGVQQLIDEIKLHQELAEHEPDAHASRESR
jgi:hypothetical protein